ncbi:MAG: DUF4421 domain-containing protein [Bacteroidales bacterium]|nr:DUF4421 domain-containing protein [Bacteroidales bacterium]MCM1147557.1 DUF4421 domain-containing protein [Bacteroidales bacterium]MCM1206347.1 DUF4421 domain-containing protein [Bacillota bacterium]MCM1511224.1 DUF4421 domain-containing protein [Clostridium sp.]
MIRIAYIFFMMFLCGSVSAQSDSIVSETIAKEKKNSLFRKVGRGIASFIREFDTVDTAYIEPQHYKFQAMMQSTTNLESYEIYQKNGASVTFAPETSTKIGPYAGYSLIFLGYTLQFNNFYISNNAKTFNLSLYTSLFGVDFYYRKVSDFRMTNVKAGDDTAIDVSPLVDKYFEGFGVERWGYNVYYIFNHRRHSYPAAYNQSTCQRRSAGSPLAGVGYSKYSLSMDWNRIVDMASQYVPEYKDKMEGLQFFENITYSCYSLYGGYSYNWVFAPNWTLGASFTAALTYNKSNGEQMRLEKFFEDFKFSNVSFDGVGRMGVVWNNTRWFAGVSGQVHTFAYNKSQFSIRNTFGNINVYVGVNFGKKKRYRTPGKFFEL